MNLGNPRLVCLSGGWCLLVLSFLAGTGLAAEPGTSATKPGASTTRPRVVISSDFPPLDVIPVKGARKGDPPEKCSDPDDVQSMVRFLLYANEFDVEALVASAGTFANVANKQNILDILNLYAKVHENLRRHDPRYPTAERLRSVTWQGRSGSWGTSSVGTTAKPLDQILGDGKDSEASDAIISVVDRADPRPVWVCVWGGSREVAQAIWKVRATRSPAELQRVLSKLRIYMVVKQDSTAQWLLDSFPSLFIILSEKNYMGMFWNMRGADPKLADLAWINVNIRQGHGPLGAVYPQSGWDPKYPGQQEGDTPSFLHLVSAQRGLNDPEKPDQGGWGGRFVRPDPSRNHWFDDPAGTQTVSRWRAEVQADFARRADWMHDSPLVSAGYAEDGYFESNGVRIHYIDEGTGEPVLLIHGFVADIAIQWDAPGIRQKLARDFRVIALDNRGHGKSDKPHDAAKYGTEMVEDAVRLLDHLKIRKAHVVGYSMGGTIALKLAAMHPQRLLSAALGGAGRITEADFALCDKVADALETGGDLGPLAREVLGQGKIADLQIKVVNELLARTNDPKALAAASRSLKKLMVTEEELKAIRVPTLAVVGAGDFVKRNVDDLKGLPGLKTVVIERCDHISAFFSPLYLESVQSFLKQQRLTDHTKDAE